MAGEVWNRLGPVMVLTGFLWFAGLLSEATSAPLYTLGVAIEYAFLCGFVYIVPPFRPDGSARRWTNRSSRSRSPALAFRWSRCCSGADRGFAAAAAGDNLIQVFHDNGLALALLSLQRRSARS